MVKPVKYFVSLRAKQISEYEVYSRVQSNITLEICIMPLCKKHSCFKNRAGGALFSPIVRQDQKQGYKRYCPLLGRTKHRVLVLPMRIRQELPQGYTFISIE